MTRVFEIGKSRKLIRQDIVSFLEDRKLILMLCSVQTANSYFLYLFSKFVDVKQHSTTVNQISLDMNGDYLSSCSDDGRVS